MLKIELQENTFDVEIYENVFTVNADDISNHQAIDYMLKKYRGNRNITDEFIDDYKECIDILLGEGAYKQLFKIDDMKPYYVIVALAEELQEHFEKAATTEKQQVKQNKLKEELNNLTEISKEMSNINKQMEYANKKYGMKNYVNSRQKRPSKKYNNKSKKDRNKN